MQHWISAIGNSLGEFPDKGILIIDIDFIHKWMSIIVEMRYTIFNFLLFLKFSVNSTIEFGCVIFIDYMLEISEANINKNGLFGFIFCISCIFYYFTLIWLL